MKGGGKGRASGKGDEGNRQHTTPIPHVVKKIGIIPPLTAGSWESTTIDTFFVTG